MMNQGGGGEGGVSEDQEELAQRLLVRGRERLLARLRPAFEQAAAPHGDDLVLDPETLEAMVQGAAARADGALWRRSLAAAAREELGLDLGEALIHPAVERAQELAGAPPYDRTAVADDARSADRPGEILAALDRVARDAAGDEPDSELTPQAIRLPAVHLGGIGNLARGEASLELRLSDSGLDIVRTETSTTLGRLQWSEVLAIETPRPRGRRRRRTRAQLLVRTARGEAHFEIPGITEAELRGYVDPLFEAGRES
jgi:hypothetical protein